MKRTLCIITGSRADYGILEPLMKSCAQHPKMRMQIIATGTHLAAEYGMTYRDIEKDGFTIDKKVTISLGRSTTQDISEAMDSGFSKMTHAFEQLQPDIIVICGDRFESFAAASAALIQRIPVAHIHGGEVTVGAFDDALRHSITKMSHFHFTTTEEYRRRVIQLGEHPSRVFCVGALGVEKLRSISLLSKSTLEQQFSVTFNKRNLLVTFHPVTLEHDSGRSQLRVLLDVLDKQEDTNVIFTRANADTNGIVFNEMVKDYCASHSGCAWEFASLGNQAYASFMHVVNGVVGNSSSGIIEAASFKVGTINIGDRQKGRTRADSVIDCDPTPEALEAAFQKLYSQTYQDTLKNVINPYEKADTAETIRNILIECDLENCIKKLFYDISG